MGRLRTSLLVLLAFAVAVRAPAFGQSPDTIVPLGCQPVHECLKELNIGPYEDLGNVTVGTVFRQYWPWLLTGLVVLIAIVLAAIHVLQLNLRLTRAVSTEERRTHQQAEVARFSQLALSGMSVDELFRQAVALISRVLGAKYAKVLEHRPEEGVLFLRAGVGWKEGWVGHKSVPDGAGSQGGYTLLQGKPVIAEDIENETRFSPPDLLTEHDAVGGMTVAIPGREGPFGVLGVHTDRKQRFSEDDAHFLKAVANILAAALQQRWAMDSLRESEKRFRDVFNTSADAILIFNTEGAIAWENPAASEMYGYTEREMTSLSGKDIVAPDHYWLFDDFKRQLAGTGRFQAESVDLRKDGTRFDVEVRGNSFQYRGEPHLLAIVRDITERKRSEESLQESELRHRILFESSRDAVMTLAPPSWRFTSCNPATVEMFSTKDEAEFTSLGPWELSPRVQPDGRPSADKAREVIETAMREGSHFFEWTHKRHGGEDFPATVLLTRVDLNGQAFLQATVRDITAQKQAEKDLRESEERFRRFAVASGYGLAMGELTGQLIFANAATLRIVEEESEEAFTSKTFYQYYTPEDADRLRQKILPIVMEKDRWVGEVPLLSARGNLIATEQNIFLIRDEQGAPQMVGNIITDITERKQAEERLRREKELSDDIINSLPGLFYIMDEERLVRWNKKFEAITGYSAEELGKMHCPDFHEKADKVHMVDRMQAVFREGTAEAEAEIVTKYGRRIPFYFTGLRSVLDGKPHVVGVGIDITKQKQTEMELAKARDEAEAANRAKSEFLANMSHEIRTPMTAILGYAELLRSEGDLSKAPPKRVEAIDTIIRNGNHLLNLIGDILDLSKIEAAKMTAESRECSPWHIVEEVVSSTQDSAQRKALKLSVEHAFPLPRTIRTDPVRLKQVLINLIGNAVKFTEHGGVRIGVRCTQHLDTTPPIKPGPIMQFVVTDTGIGVTKEQMNSIFQPFTQADATHTRRFGGTGLGLTISKRLAVMLGGDIQVESEPDKGSTFTLTIDPGPLDGVPMFDESPGASAEEEPAALRTRLDCRVLLAEDGLDNQRLIAFLLKKAGAEVAVAENGQIACDLALAARDEGNPFDVILMDMQMPVMDGYDATAKLREADYTGPIIALTAYAMSEDRNKCLAAGCDDYMTKPIDREKLTSVVAEYDSRQELHTAGDAR